MNKEDIIAFARRDKQKSCVSATHSVPMPKRFGTATQIASRRC